MNQVAPSTRKLMKLAQNALAKHRGQEAFDLFQQVLALNPDHVEAICQSAFILHGSGHYQGAMEFYQRAIRTDPNYIESYLMLGRLLESKNQQEESIRVVRLATEIEPQNPKTHAAFVSLLLRFSYAHEVPAYLENILWRFPDELELQQFYAIGLKVNNRRAEADALYAKLISKFSVPASFRMIYETYLPRFYVSMDEIDAVRSTFAASIEQFIRQKPAVNIAMVSNHPLFVMAFHNRDNKDLLQRYTKMLRLCAPELNYVAPHCKASLSKKKPIRIGFISSHMHNHSVGNCYRNAMIHLAADPECDVIFFNLVNIVDEKTQEIEAAGIPIISLPKNIVAAYKVVADKKLDVVIYPDIGMDATTHYMAMARLAPYQACFQGHPETTGIDTIDYVISSRSYEPPHADENYTERLLCNAGIDTVFKRPAMPECWMTRAELGLPEGKKLYVCPMAIQKIHPDFDAVLADILMRDPNAVIVLFNDFMQQISSELLQRRILEKCDPSRVVFLGWQPVNVLFSILNEADAILDTIYFGGGTTAQLAFHFGFPIITMPGHYARGRVVFSYYTLMGIENAPIAQRLEDYVPMAIKLANDRDYHAALRNEILEKNHLIFDTEPYGPKLVQLVKDIVNQNLDDYCR